MLKRYIVKRYEYNPYTVPFYVEDLSGNGGTLTVNARKTNAANIEYSTDGTAWSSTNPGIPANGKLYMRAEATYWGTSSWSAGASISVNNSYQVGGNLMSLFYGSGFTGDERVFPSNTSWICGYMFFRQDNLINADKLLLPAMTLTDYAYRSMFENCHYLLTLPELPALTMTTNCYVAFAMDCRALRKACELPATTLASSCYRSMFERCNNLDTAPSILPATAPIASNCYYMLFNNTKVTEVRLGATSWSTNAAPNWLGNVPATGTVYINSALDGVIPENSTSGIPSGWTKVILNQ